MTPSCYETLGAGCPVGSGESTTLATGLSSAVVSSDSDIRLPTPAFWTESIEPVQTTSSASYFPASSSVPYSNSTITSSTFPATLASQTTESAPFATVVAVRSKGVSKGATAGIAVATAIVGAAIAFTIAFFLFKRRSRRFEPVSTYDSHSNLVYNPKNVSAHQIPQISNTPPPVAAGPVTRDVGEARDMHMTNLSPSLGLLAGILPPAANQRTVTAKVSAIFNQILQHVEDYYRDVHATMTPSMEGELARFGSGNRGLLELLQSSSRPTVAIKHALMGYVLSIVSPAQGDEMTLFPSDIVGVGPQEQFTGSSDMSAAYTMYRRLAVYLSSASPTNASSTRLSARLSDIREAAEHFSLTFFPWANPMSSDQEKDDDLMHIIRTALELSIWMHGQPFLYRFIWESTGRRGTTVAPGLARVSDAEGRVDVQPEFLLEPVVVPA